MRTFMLTLLAGTLATTAAIAQSPSGNVAQPERAVPQAGSTTRGPIDNPSVYGRYRDADSRIDVDATGSVANRRFNSTGEAIFEDSAKGGNADQTNKDVPNIGTTSGGPEF